VVEELVQGQQVALLSTDVGSMEYYSKTDRIPKSVRDVLVKAIGLRNEQTDTQRQIDDRRRQVSEITNEQTRIRENIKTVDRTSEYAGRLLKKLNDQETTLEKLQGEIGELQKKLDQQRKAFEQFLQSTSVEEK
jgi:chromosome segregation ATPase